MTANKGLIEKLHQLGIRRVAVFDDEVENLSSPWIKDNEAWAGLILFLEERIRENLGTKEADRARTVDSLEERLALFSQIEQFASPEEISVYEPETNTKRLKQWLDVLRSWNLQVDTFSSWADFKRKADAEAVQGQKLLQCYHLILLDYDFGEKFPPDHSNSIATEVSEMLSSALEKDANCPLLIRFSQLRVEKTEAEKHLFTQKIGFPRGCYEFLDKSIVSALSDFEERFSLLIRDFEVGLRLYQLSAKMATVISRTVSKEAMHVLYHLDPESIRFLSSQRLQPEGVAETEYLIDLLHNLFYSSLSCSQPVAEATKELIEHIRNERKPGDAFENIGLYYVQNRLLFNYKINYFQRPIGFGDIFLFGNGDNVGIVITQSCDMSVREITTENGSLQGEPEAEFVLLIQGKIVPPSDASGNVTRYFTKFQDDNQYLMIKWDFKNPITLPRAILDLVSLNNDGQAVIPDEHADLSSPWWTQSYVEYISTLSRKLRDNLVWLDSSESGGVKRIMISIPGDGIRGTENTNTFGTSIVYPVEQKENSLVLPVRRIARFQTVEALRLQQQYYAAAGRIGVMTELRQTTREVKIQVLNSQNAEHIKLLPATYISGKSADGKKTWKKLMVHPSLIRELQDFDGEFTALSQAISEYTVPFDLYEIYDSGNCSNCYKIENIQNDPTRMKLCAKRQQANRRHSTQTSIN